MPQGGVFPCPSMRDPSDGRFARSPGTARVPPARTAIVTSSLSSAFIISQKMLPSISMKPRAESVRTLLGRDAFMGTPGGQEKGDGKGRGSWGGTGGGGSHQGMTGIRPCSLPCKWKWSFAQNRGKPAFSPHGGAAGAAAGELRDSMPRTRKWTSDSSRVSGFFLSRRGAWLPRRRPMRGSVSHVRTERRDRGIAGFLRCPYRELPVQEPGMALVESGLR